MLKRIRHDCTPYDDYVDAEDSGLVVFMGVMNRKGKATFDFCVEEKIPMNYNPNEVYGYNDGYSVSEYPYTYIRILDKFKDMGIEYVD